MNDSCTSFFPSQLRNIVLEESNLEINKDPPLGLLTTELRDIWALNRIEFLKNNAHNQLLLDTLESAAFLVCLDETSPNSLEEVNLIHIVF